MKEEDILARQARPQQHSTFVPKTRDWRYETGVFQHGDNENAKERSAWDAFDYDSQVAGTKRTRSDSKLSDGGDTDLSETVSLSRTPDKAASMAFSEGGSKAIIKLGSPRKRARTKKQSKWMQVLKYKPSEEQSLEGEEQTNHEVYSLTVKLRFSNKLVVEDAQSPTDKPDQHTQSQAPDTPYAPTAAHTAEAINPPANSRMPNASNVPATTRAPEKATMPKHCSSTESLRTTALFQRTWVDETEHFNMVDVRKKLQGPSREINELGENYSWYTDAVPVNAILPPGIPMSAKEVMAFYPHHVRWNGMMLRLTHNDYRGHDMLAMQAFFRGPSQRQLHPGQMNQFQRDGVKQVISGFRMESYKGAGNANLSTANIKPGKYISERVPGFTVPSYDDIVNGVRCFPSGIDARVLTECLAWYITVRDIFTPRLQINVLHTQALSRALRVPIRGYGPQNLDYLALREWKEKGKFEARRLGEIFVASASAVEDVGVQEVNGRSRLHMNLDSEDVRLEHKVSIRHVLTVPFVALHGVMSEALKLGIKKAEAKAKARGLILKPPTTTTTTTTTTGNHPSTNTMKPPPPPFTTPPRPLTTANLRTLPPAHRKLAPATPPTPRPTTPSRLTPGPRQAQQQPQSLSQSYSPSPFATPGPPASSYHQGHPPRLHHTVDTAPPLRVQPGWETPLIPTLTPATAQTQSPYYSGPSNGYGYGRAPVERYSASSGPGFVSSSSPSSHDFAPAHAAASYDSFVRTPVYGERRVGYGEWHQSRGGESRGDGGGVRDYGHGHGNGHGHGYGYGYGYGYGHGEEYGYDAYDGRCDGHDSRQVLHYHHDDYRHGGWSGDDRRSSFSGSSSGSGGGSRGGERGDGYGYGDGYGHGHRSVYRR